MRALSIVHLTTFLQGGAGRAITDLACAQQENGNRVLVVASATGEDGYGNYPHYVERLRAAGVPLLLEDSLFKRDPALNLRVLEQLQTAGPHPSHDVIHAHAGTPASVGLRYAWRADRRTAVIQTQHGWGTNKTPEQSRHDLAVLREVDRVVVTSNATKAMLKANGIPDEQMRTIPCGIPGIGDRGSGIGEALAVIAPLRARGFRVVGCVGSVTGNKNQRLLVEAISRISDRAVAAVCVGEGGEQLVELARALGVSDRIHVLGYRPDADQWMPAFDLLAIPSFTEGQGLAALEAFRAGVPVIASDIPALREVVTEGESGWLFDPNDADDMAAAIECALDASTRQRAHVVETARRRFLEHYTLDVMTARHDDLYRELLDDRSDRQPQRSFGSSAI